MAAGFFRDTKTCRKCQANPRFLKKNQEEELAGAARFERASEAWNPQKLYRIELHPYGTQK
jgi:hypothetical protein